MWAAFEFSRAKEQRVRKGAPRNSSGENAFSGTVVKAGMERKELFIPIHPSLGDRACHNSAEQTRAACQHLIC